MFFSISLLIFSLLSGTSIARAEDPTPTPTPWYVDAEGTPDKGGEQPSDKTPVYLTQTPGATPVLDELGYCPDGVPAGYGTLTPSAEWMIECGSCLPVNTSIYGEYTPVPLPSGLEWDGITTPVPTEPPPPPPARVYAGSWVATALMYPWEQKSFTLPVQTSDLVIGYQLTGHWSGGAGSCVIMWDNAGYFSQQPIDLYYPYEQYQIYTKGNYTTAIDAAGLLHDGGIYNAGGSAQSFTVGSTLQINHRTYYCDVGWTVQADYRLLYYGQEVIEEDPTPEATPDKYSEWMSLKDSCYEIEPVPVGETFEGVELPEVQYGEYTCYKFGGVEADPAQMGLITYLLNQISGRVANLPPFSVCVQEVTFGKVNIFGELVDLDIFAALAAGALVLVLVVRR